MSDYGQFLVEAGITENFARLMSVNTLDQIVLEHDYDVCVKDSDIEGRGLFAAICFSAGAAIMPANINGKRTIAGRYTNHSGEPNAEIFPIDGDLGLFAITDIMTGEELTVDYRKSLAASTAVSQYKMSLNIDHRNKMKILESAIIATEETVDLDVKHYYAHGTYTRELFIQAGIVLTGKIHKYSCVNTISQGEMRVLTGEGALDVVAPYTFISGPGVKKAGFAITDTIWTTTHPWDGKEDPELIVEEFTFSSYEDFDKYQLQRIGGL